MNYSSWFGGLRYEIEPAARRDVTALDDAENVCSDRVAAAKAVEQPAIQSRFLERLLYWFDQNRLQIYQFKF